MPMLCSISNSNSAASSRLRFPTTPLVAIALALVASSCQSLPGLRILQRVHQVTPDGSLSANQVDGALNFSDLDLDNSDLNYEFRAEIDMEQVLLIADVRRFGSEGNGVLPTDFALDGSLFEQGDVVRANMSIKLLRGLFLWKLMPDDPWSLDLGLGVAAVDTRFSLTDVFDGNAGAVDELGTVPFLVGRTIYRFSDFEIEGMLSYIDASYDLTDLRYIDLDLTGRWRFVGEADDFSAWLELGYRSTDLSVDFLDDPAKVDVSAELSGPYLGLAIQF